MVQVESSEKFLETINRINFQKWHSKVKIVIGKDFEFEIRARGGILVNKPICVLAADRNVSSGVELMSTSQCGQHSARKPGKGRQKDANILPGKVNIKHWYR